MSATKLVAFHTLGRLGFTLEASAKIYRAACALQRLHEAACCWMSTDDPEYVQGAQRAMQRILDAVGLHPSFEYTVEEQTDPRGCTIILRLVGGEREHSICAQGYTSAQFKRISAYHERLRAMKGKVIA